MAFDESFTEQVRNSVSIVRVIDGYVPLKKKGKDYGALCPFHNEKTPSFWVSEAKQIFKCFGCGEGGDVFSFVMRMDSLSFPEAVRSLAEGNGIALPDTQRDPQRDEKKKRLMKLLESAARLFQKALRSPERGGQAAEYLHKRGITSKTIADCGMGYAPAGSDLLGELREAGYSREDLLDCGLFKKNERGQVYSYFRNRIMFPIRNLSGQIIAFGGRILGDGQPKYLNSPETDLYVKSRHLYGMNWAREAIRSNDLAVLVEGYFDCAVPRQFGFDNVVAALGTSLTAEQVKLLSRFTHRAVINYDPDLAGAKAAQRSIGLLLEQGFQVRVLDLPDGQDPDDFLQRNGGAAYQELLDEAPPFLDYLLERFVAEEEDARGPRGKSRIVSRIMPYVQGLRDRIERAEYLAMIGSRLQVEERFLREELRRRPEPGELGDESIDDRSEELTTRSEKILLTAVLDPDFRSALLDRLDIEYFRGLASEGIFEDILRLWKEGTEPTPHKLRAESRDSAMIDLMERLSFEKAGLPVSDDSIEGSILSLRLMQVRGRRRELQERMNQTDVPFEEMKSTLAHYEQLRQEERQLRASAGEKIH